MDVATHCSEMQKSLENNLELLYLKDLDNLQSLIYVGLNRIKSRWYKHGDKNVDQLIEYLTKFRNP